MKEERKYSDEELLEKVEKAAEKGANKGRIRDGILSSLPTLAVIAIIAFLLLPKVFSLNDGLRSFFKLDEPVENQDMTIENYGILGYKAVDFEEAILGDSEKLKKMEVFRQEVSDAATQTDTGMFNLSVFTKTQIITYTGTATYTVDLSTIKRSDISYDEEQNIVTIKIPHAKQEEINIPEDRIQFGDTTKGLLAFGEMKLSAEDTYKIQAGARENMQQKLDEWKVIENADKVAKAMVWELYTPIVKAVGKDVSLEIEFR